MKEEVLNMVNKSGIIWREDFLQEKEDNEYESCTQFESEKCEYIFLLDRSGSMEGSSIRLAVEALKLFLYSLPAGCFFNIVSFGSDFEQIYKKSVPYSDETLNETVGIVSGYEADLGGTEILAPL